MFVQGAHPSLAVRVRRSLLNHDFSSLSYSELLEHGEVRAQRHDRFNQGAHPGLAVRADGPGRHGSRNAPPAQRSGAEPGIVRLADIYAARVQHVYEAQAGGTKQHRGTGWGGAGSTRLQVPTRQKDNMTGLE